MLKLGVETINNILSEWASKGVTEEELRDKKTTIVGLFKVTLATTNGLVQTIVSLAERRRPTSYLDEYPLLIQKVTLEEVNNETLIRFFLFLQLKKL